jgi:hypothetical protein
VQCKFPRTLTLENLFYCPLDRRHRVGKAQVEARADTPRPGGGPRGGRGWGWGGAGIVKEALLDLIDRHFSGVVANFQVICM